MTGFFGPGGCGDSPFDEFLARFFGAGAPRREVQRVDITRLMTAPARELVAAAARKVLDRGEAYLDTLDLLWAATQLEPTRQLLERAGADPAKLDWIARRGYQPEFGARPMRRTIQREVDNRLSTLLLNGDVRPGEHVAVDTRDDELVRSSG